jgi:HSP20 family molecular chaperone IbpA
MSEHLTITVEPQDESAPAKVLCSRDSFKHMRELYDTVARRAFQAFEGRGRKHGYDFDDWIKAESELLHPVHLAIAGSDDAVTVRAEVPGFCANDLEVRVDGHRLTVSGKRETSENQWTRKTVYTECCSNEIFRPVELPPEANPAKIHATLNNGVLEFVMPKIVKKQTLPLEESRA